LKTRQEGLVSEALRARSPPAAYPMLPRVPDGRLGIPINMDFMSSDSDCVSEAIQKSPPGVYDALQQEIERVRLVPALESCENEYPQ
jgi:hypothetical protein